MTDIEEFLKKWDHIPGLYDEYWNGKTDDEVENDFDKIIADIEHFSRTLDVVAYISLLSLFRAEDSDYMNMNDVYLHAAEKMLNYPPVELFTNPNINTVASRMRQRCFNTGDIDSILYHPTIKIFYTVAENFFKDNTDSMDISEFITEEQILLLNTQEKMLLLELIDCYEFKDIYKHHMLKNVLTEFDMEQLWWINGHTMDRENAFSFIKTFDTVMEDSKSYEILDHIQEYLCDLDTITDPEAWIIIDATNKVGNNFDGFDTTFLNLVLMAPNWPYGQELLLSLSNNEAYDEFKSCALSDGSCISQSDSLPVTEIIVSDNIEDYYSKINISMLTLEESRFILLVINNRFPMFTPIPFKISEDLLNRIELLTHQITLTRNEETGLDQMRKNVFNTFVPLGSSKTKKPNIFKRFGKFL